MYECVCVCACERDAARASMCSCATKHLFWLQRSSFVCPSRGKPAICCKWAQSMWSLQASGSRKVKSWTETRSLSLFIQLLKVGLSLWPTFTLISFLNRLFWNSNTYCRIEKINLNLWTVGYMFKLLYVASSLPTWLSWGSVLMFVWQWLSSETKSTWLGWEKKHASDYFGGTTTTGEVLASG